jgi:hypothetical protein
MYFLGHDSYLVAVPGYLNCSLLEERTVLNMSRTAILSLGREDYCENSALSFGPKGLRMKRYVVDTQGDRTLDRLLLQRATAEDLLVEGPVHSKKAHETLNLRVKQDLANAQADLEGLVVDTELQFASHQVQSYGIWVLLLVVFAVIVVMLLLVYWRFRAARRAVAAAGLLSGIPS